MRLTSFKIYTAVATTLAGVTAGSLVPSKIPYQVSSEGFARRSLGSSSLMRPLERFVLQLRVFVTESQFYDHAFDMHKASYAQHIEELRCEVAKMGIPNKEVSKQLEFASGKFGAMAAASAYRKHPHDKEVYGKSLIRDINDLYIFLLKAQDCHGDPDPQVDRFADIVKSFRDRVRVLNRRSLGLTEAEMPSFLLFQMHARLEEVDKAVEKMESEVNKDLNQQL